MEDRRRSFEFRLLDQAAKIRLALVGFFLVMGIAAPRELIGNFAMAGSVVAFAALYATFNHFVVDWRLVRRDGQVHLLAAILLCVDVLLISSFTWFMGPEFGGLTTLLLLPVVFAAAMFSGFELPIMVGIVCGAQVVLYLGMGGVTTGGQASAWNVGGAVGASVLVAWLAYAVSEVPRRERAATDHIVKNLTEGVMLLSSTGEVIVVNPRVEHMTGVNASEVVGLNVNQASHRAALAPLMPMLEDAIHEGSAGREIGVRSLHLEDPSPMEVQCLTVPCTDVGGQVSAWVIVCRDVTEMLSNVRAREEGIAVISHELRNRLLSVRAASELLIRMSDTLSLDVRNETLRLLDMETRRLSRLVGRTLDAAAVADGSTPCKFELVHLDRIAREACYCLQAGARKKNISLLLDVESAIPPVNGDAIRLDQVVQNLVENAIKYTPDCGVVNIGVRHEAGEVKVSITDTGPGVAEDRRDDIFQKFVHGEGDESDGSNTGIGLGLYICRAIVERHSGAISVTGTEQGGANFTFTIPVAEVDMHVHASEPVRRDAQPRTQGVQVS